MRFALPCPCGNSIPVQQGQAGSTVVCPQCSKSVDVPTIRGLQSLAVIEEGPSDSKNSQATARQWNPIRGIVAVLCLAVAIYTLWPALEWGWFRINSDYSFTLEDELREGEKIVQKLTPVQAWDTWQFYQESGLLNRKPSTYFQTKALIEKTDPKMIQFAIVGGIAVVIMLVALFWPSRKNRSNRAASVSTR